MSSDAFDFEDLLLDVESRMEMAVDALKKEFAGLRTGRASVGLLEPIQIEVYGAMTPLKQVGSIGVPEPRMLSVQVWDKTTIKAVEKGIRDSGLGLNPVVDGQTVRVPIPPLTEERRRELSKIAGKYTEQSRVSVRNARRDGMESLKKAEKDGAVSKDDIHQYGEDIQKMTDRTIKQVDELLVAKEQEIMQV
ncbi:MAG: ribosome recycling factor [Rhodospirillaceae bacterium]|nr:ribosome recycling factor [Rhodospirillaceae bacterium]